MINRVPARPTTRGGEIRSLTGVRGVAALGVASYHLFGRPNSNNPINTIVGNGYLFVDLFFVLSGFVMALTYGRTFATGFSLTHFRQFLWARIARIYPLYALMTLVSFVLLVSGVSRVPRLQDVEFILLANLALVQNLGLALSLDEPCWSISVEFIAYLAFPLIAVIALGKSWRYAATLFAAAALLILLVSQMSDEMLGETARNRRGLMDVWHYSSVGPILRCLAGFSAGVVVYRCFSAPALFRLAGRPLVGVTILAVILLLMAGRGNDLYVLAFMPPLILSLSTGNAELEMLFGNRLVHNLGVYSYAIYLLHPHFRILFDTCERLIDLPADLRFPLSVIITMTMLVLAAMAAYHFVEQPARRLIRFEKRTVEARST